MFLYIMRILTSNILKMFFKNIIVSIGCFTSIKINRPEMASVEPLQTPVKNIKWHTLQIR